MPPDHVLAIDQGTTSTRAMLFDREARMVSVAQRELPQHYPRAGWVEHDAEDIWRDTLAVVREAIAGSAVSLDRIAAIGVTNQRETVVVWDRSTGEPIHRAIVWQDRRTADLCASLKAEGTEEEVRAKTGLLLDPYFSATKLAWILDNVADARARAERGELAFGTIDSFLLWRLTGGAVHATDATNASRTMLYDIHAQRWDADLCRLFRIPEALLPEVRDNSGSFGATAAGLLDRQIPIGGMAGDQQAALIGQACFDPGMVKSTYGTGCFLLLNTGETAVRSANRLLTTPAYRLDGRTTYAVEGSIFVAGAAIKWLRDGLGILGDAAESESLATRVADSHGVYMVPAFVGLGAPHWDPDARAAIHGLTLDATARPSRPRGARSRRLSDARPARSDGGGRLRRSRRASCRRRNGGQWLALPVPRRHPRLPCRSPGQCRDDRTGRGIPRGAGNRRLEGSRGGVADLERWRELQPSHGARPAPSASRRLA